MSAISSTPAPHATAADSDLSRAELHRLTLFKWRYSFESMGFDRSEVDHLVFLTWLRATARVHG